MSTQYTATAKAFHWLMAALILGLLVLGFYMQDLPLSPDKLKLYAWHKWAGVTVFVLVWVRLAWRLAHRPPALPDSMPLLLRIVAHVGHMALYLLMIVIPLSGWLMSSAKGFQTVWFGVLPLPDLVAKDKALGDFLHEVHEVLNLMLLSIMMGHALMALKHHWIDKDDILTRMLPARRR